MLNTFGVNTGYTEPPNGYYRLFPALDAVGLILPIFSYYLDVDTQGSYLLQ
jgi:hypothetical protein